MRFIGVGVRVFEFFDFGFENVEGGAGGGLVGAFDGGAFAGGEALAIDAQFDSEDAAMVGAEALDDGVVGRGQADRLQSLLEGGFVIGGGQVLRVDFSKRVG